MPSVMNNNFLLGALLARGLPQNEAMGVGLAASQMSTQNGFGALLLKPVIDQRAAVETRAVAAEAAQVSLQRPLAFTVAQDAASVQLDVPDSKSVTWTLVDHSGGVEFDAKTATLRFTGYSPKGDIANLRATDGASVRQIRVTRVARPHEDPKNVVKDETKSADDASTPPGGPGSPSPDGGSKASTKAAAANATDPVTPAPVNGSSPANKAPTTPDPLNPAVESFLDSVARSFRFGVEQFAVAHNTLAGIGVRLVDQQRRQHELLIDQLQRSTSSSDRSSSSGTPSPSITGSSRSSPIETHESLFDHRPNSFGPSDVRPSPPEASGAGDPTDLRDPDDVGRVGTPGGTPTELQASGPRRGSGSSRPRKRSSSTRT